MRPLAHESVFEKLSAAAAGALEPEQEREVRTHVAECSTCADELDALQKIAGSLQRLPTPQPSDGLVRRVQNQIALELATRSDERLNLIVVSFLLVFSWTVTVAGFFVFRVLTGEGPSLVGALSGSALPWSLSYFATAWASGAAAVVLLSIYPRKRRVA